MGTYHWESRQAAFSVEYTHKTNYNQKLYHLHYGDINHSTLEENLISVTYISGLFKEEKYIVL